MRCPPDCWCTGAIPLRRLPRPPQAPYDRGGQRHVRPRPGDCPCANAPTRALRPGHGQRTRSLCPTRPELVLDPRQSQGAAASQPVQGYTAGRRTMGNPPILGHRQGRREYVDGSAFHEPSRAERSYDSKPTSLTVDYSGFAIDSPCALLSQTCESAQQSAAPGACREEARRHAYIDEMTSTDGLHPDWYTTGTKRVKRNERVLVRRCARRLDRRAASMSSAGRCRVAWQRVERCSIGCADPHTRE